MGQHIDDRIQPVIGEELSVAELHNSAECFLQAFHASPYVQTVTTFDSGQYLYVNDSFVRAAGYDREEVIGKNAIEIGILADKPDRNWLTDGLRKRGRLINEKVRFRLRSGTVRTGLVNAQMINLDGGDYILSTVTDIDEQLSAAERYHQLNCALADLAHEIKNPLAGIKGVADAFLRRSRLTSLERDWMETVRHEVSKIDMRMQELLDLSRPRILNVEECSLNELIKGVVMLASCQAESTKEQQRREVSIEFIDKTKDPIVMPIDPAQIEDAVLNLVLNALESIAGSGRVTVCLSQRSAVNKRRGPAVSEAVIEVSDTGCGIPVKDRLLIFEPHFTTKQNGTGLGLAAVRRTAAISQGSVSFKTRIGRGSTFTLVLPIRRRVNLTENP